MKRHRKRRELPHPITLHVRVTLEDGRVVVDEDISNADPVTHTADLHATIAQAYGQAFELLVTDPDGEVEPMRLQFEVNE